jgi:hypothetical protein
VQSFWAEAAYAVILFEPGLAFLPRMYFHSGPRSAAMPRPGLLSTILDQRFRMLRPPTAGLSA